MVTILLILDVLTLLLMIKDSCRSALFAVDLSWSNAKEASLLSSSVNTKECVC